MRLENPEASASPVDAVERLRRIREAVVRGEPLPSADGRWLAEVVSDYEAGAPGGVTLDEVVGLTPAPGGRPWHAIEALRRRDELIRRVAREHLAGLSIWEQAERIAQDARRYVRGAWQIDRRRPVAEAPPTTRRELLRAAFRAAPVPLSVSRVYEILSCELPELVE